ncbi:MAG: DUF5673 domain-containing protein [Cellulosilyticaceae bacterium]
MEWLTPIVIVLICLVPTISIFFTGEKEYIFKRNIFRARALQTQMLAAVAIISIGFIFVDYTLYIKDMVTFAALFLSLGILTVVNFNLKGEGAYDKGLLIKGTFIPWQSISKYQIKKSDKPNVNVLYLHMQNKKATRVRKYVLEEDYRYNLDKILRRHVK